MQFLGEIQEHVREFLRQPSCRDILHNNINWLLYFQSMDLIPTNHNVMIGLKESVFLCCLLIAEDLLLPYAVMVC